MHERDHGEQHPLVAGREVVQHFAGFLALLFQIIRHNSREVLVAVLPALPVGNVGFHTEELVLHLAHGFVGRHGDHVNGEHHAPVEVGQLQNHAVFDVAGVILEEQDATIMTSHFEVVTMKLQAVRADRVLEIMPALHGRLQVERQCTSNRSAASSSLEDELSRESLEDTSPVTREKNVRASSTFFL